MTTKALAVALQARLRGPGSVSLSGVASPAGAGPHDLVFAEANTEDEAALSAALNSRAGAVLAAELAAHHKTKKPVLIVDHPRLAFARAAKLLRARQSTPAAVHAQAVHPAAVHPQAVHPQAVHPQAVVSRKAKLGKDVSIGANAVISENCAVGARTAIAANCFIGAGVKLGIECQIGPNVTIYPGVELGKRVMVQAGTVLGSAGFGYVRDPASGRYEPFPQIGTLVIGNDVEIGAHCTIDRGALEATIIGDGVKIDNLVHIAHNVKIGANVVIAALTGISGSVVVERNVIIGGQVGIGDHARIEEGVILGSGAGVLTKKIVRGQGIVFWGRPAKPLRRYLKELATLSRIAKE